MLFEHCAKSALRHQFLITVGVLLAAYFAKLYQEARGVHVFRTAKMTQPRPNYLFGRVV